VPQITSKEEELEALHSGLRKMEDSLDRSQAEKDLERRKCHAQVNSIMQQKAELQKQLQSKRFVAKEAQAVAAANKLAAMSQKLARMEQSKSQLERRVLERQVQGSSMLLTFFIVRHTHIHRKCLSSLWLLASRCQKDLRCQLLFFHVALMCINCAHQMHPEYGMLLQMERDQAEQRSRKELVALARKLRDTERRAVALLQDSAKQQNLLRHKHRQLCDSNRKIKELQVCCCKCDVVISELDA
jgi:hypothetical protein